MTNKSIDGRQRPILGLLCCFCLLTAGCSADTSFVNFATLARSDTPNDALACPAALCQAKADLTTGAVAIPAGDLVAKVIAVLAEEPRTELVTRDAGGLKLVFVQRSRIFRFPDTVNIEILPQGDASALLAIYSRSNYGHGDLGVNSARVTDWLAKFGVPATGN
nr:DUF1499 domain-containing protein [uncultured Dongia sp.]